jgi:hypothetical protein
MLKIYVGGISDAESVPNWKAKSASGDASHAFSVVFSTEQSNFKTKL